MRTSIILLGIFVTFLSLWACENETLPPQNSQLGLEYFPLEVSRYAVYEVKEINYSVVAEPDTQQYQLKELVADSFPGQGGEIIYRLERFYREDDTQAWDLDSVWTARKNKQRIVVVENNIPQIKLVFPLDIGAAWDVNALNSREEQLYELRNTNDALLTEMITPVDSLLSDELFTVIQAESQDTIINRVEASETYLKHVGLFYKKSLRLHYCASEPECVGLGILESGRDYRQTLIDYGYENK